MNIHLRFRGTNGWGVWLAVLLFGTSAWLYAPVLSANRSHLWRPLSVPFSVSPGTITTPEFEVYFTGDYDIGLKTRSKANAQTSRFQPDAIDVSWQLFEASNPVQVAPTVVVKGNSREYGSVPMQSGSQIRPIGLFRAEQKHVYQLALHVEKGAPQIDADRPSLVVELDPSAAKDYFVGLYLRRELSTVLVISAVLITLFSIRWRPSFHCSLDSR